jgi:ligand-binding sensor domain-containing protein
MTEDSERNLWFCGITGRLSYFHGDHISPLSANTQIQNSLKNNFITSMYVDRSGVAWITTQKRSVVWQLSYSGIDSMNVYGRHTFIKFVDKTGLIYGNRLETGKSGAGQDTLELIDAQGRRNNLPFKTNDAASTRLWFIKLQNGNYLFAKGRNMLQLHGDKIIYNSIIPRTDYICISEDHESNIWIGYPKGGAVCYSYKNGRLDSLSAYLPGKTISRILEDREGNFWFTTVEDGVYLITSRAYISYNANEGLGDSRITSLTGNDNIVWAGSGNGFIHAIDKDGRLFRSIDLQNFGNPVQSLYMDSHNKLWIGAIAFNFCYDKGKLIRAGAHRGIKVFTEGKDYTIWAGRSMGIARYDGNHPQQDKEYNFDNYVNAVCEDSNRKLWIGCINGLWQYNGRTFEYYGEKDIRFSSRVTDIKKDCYGRLWMTTLGAGVLIWDRNKILQISKKDSLSSDLCNSVFIDKTNTAWVCTNDGLCKISPAKEGRYQVENFSIANGLISNEVYSAFRQGNKVWVATSAGLTVFDINKVKAPVANPLIYITSLTINGRDTTVTQGMKLSYSQNFLNIKFLGLLFKSTGHVKYRYKLEGIDDDWMYTSFPSVQYPALPPGNYTFIVSAANYYGKWVNDEARLSFTVTPPFWKQIWFIPSIALLLILASGIIIYFQLTQFIQKKGLLEQLNQYKHQALSAQMSPHFIFNALNSIQKYILQNDKVSSNKYLTSFAGLMRLTFENSLQTIIPLESELNALKLYLELEKMRFKEKLEYTIKINPYIALQNIKIPALLIQPFVENAIRHGIMHKEGIGHIGITIEEKEQKVICTVEDDGVGRANAAEFNKVRNSKHHSAGMELSKNRVEIMNMLYKTDMGISVDDIFLNGEPAGTRVSIVLPAVNKVAV